MRLRWATLKKFNPAASGLLLCQPWMTITAFGVDAVLSEGLDGVGANAGRVGSYPHHGALVLEKRLLEQLGYLPDDARVAVLTCSKQMFGAEANTESSDTHVMSQVPGERKP
jgi:hypothetical protein